jgi:hypothetical protein
LYPAYRASKLSPTEALKYEWCLRTYVVL